MEKKSHMKARGQASPDGGDSLCLTFTETVYSAEEEFERNANQGDDGGDYCYGTYDPHGVVDRVY